MREGPAPWRAPLGAGEETITKKATCDRSTRRAGLEGVGAKHGSLFAHVCTMLQEYLAHKKHPPPKDHHRSLGIGLLYGPTGGGGSYERCTPVVSATGCVGPEHGALRLVQNPFTPSVNAAAFDTAPQKPQTPDPGARRIARATTHNCV